MNQTQILEESMHFQKDYTNWRRWLHSHAETGFDLTATCTFVRTTLEQMGYFVNNCGKSGLVTTLGSGSPVILLRADMDALPIHEETNMSYTCKNGSMHACGHDMHTTMLLGAAKLLKDHESELTGTVKFVFQPAEEILEGSKNMIDHGVLKNPRVDAAIMIHVTTGTPLPAGIVIVSAPGVTAPAADYFTIRVQGKGCHGSMPQNGVDAITAAAHVLIALQEIQARELPASDESVLTVGTFHGGTASNVIADSATLSGTMRSYDTTVREFLKERITSVSQSIAKAYRANSEVAFGSGCPPLTNNEALCRETFISLQNLLKDHVINAADFGSTRSGGSEDFAYISQEVPSVMLAIAAGEPEKGYTYPLHHPKVTFDESVLPVGAAVFAHTAMEYLKTHKKSP